jgi:hypothetical protein
MMERGDGILRRGNGRPLYEDLQLEGFDETDQRWDIMGFRAKGRRAISTKPISTQITV